MSLAQPFHSLHVATRGSKLVARSSQIPLYILQIQLNLVHDALVRMLKAVLGALDFFHLRINLVASIVNGGLRLGNLVLQIDDLLLPSLNLRLQFQDLLLLVVHPLLQLALQGKAELLLFIEQNLAVVLPGRQQFLLGQPNGRSRGVS